MTAEEWAKLFASLGEKELKDAMLMSADEPMFEEKQANFLRDRARSDVSIAPAHSYGKPPRYYWYGHIDEKADTIDNQWIYSQLPYWLIDDIGRVNDQDEPSKHGKWTVYCDTENEAWLMLLKALSRSTQK